jgi:hypothetical protein
MSTRPFDQHIDAMQLEAYAAQQVDVTTETIIEQHLLDCGECRAALADAAADGNIAQITPDRLGTIWTGVASRIDQPPTSFLLRVRRVIKRVWNGVLQFLAFSTAAGSIRWVRWAVVPVALAATALVVMNIVGTTTPSSQRSAAAPADSVVGDAAHSLASNAASGGGGVGDSAPYTGFPSAGEQGQPTRVAAQGLGSAPPTVRTTDFRPGQYVAAFLPDAPDGNDVAVADGVLVAGHKSPAPDALTQAEARWQQVVALGLGAEIMVVDDGKFLVYVGPYDTEQQAQALCAHSGPAQRCVAAEPRPKTDALIRGLPIAV